MPFADRQKTTHSHRMMEEFECAKDQWSGSTPAILIECRGKVLSNLADDDFGEFLLPFPRGKRK